MSVAPIIVENFPDTQLLQVELTEAPSVAENFPAKQLVHSSLAPVVVE
jgi:hypothetical protein